LGERTHHTQTRAAASSFQKGLIRPTLTLYTERPFAEFAKLDPETVGQSIAAMIGAAVWITYVIKSRRVANTFTK